MIIPNQQTRSRVQLQADCLLPAPFPPRPALRVFRYREMDARWKKKSAPLINRHAVPSNGWFFDDDQPDRFQTTMVSPSSLQSLGPAEPTALSWTL